MKEWRRIVEEGYIRGPPPPCPFLKGPFLVGSLSSWSCPIGGILDSNVTALCFVWLLWQKYFWHLIQGSLVWVSVFARGHSIRRRYLTKRSDGSVGGSVWLYLPVGLGLFSHHNRNQERLFLVFPLFLCSSTLLMNGPNRPFPPRVSTINYLCSFEKGRQKELPGLDFYVSYGDVCKVQWMPLKHHVP